MARCINEHCDIDPLNSPNAVPWGCDGDLACCPECHRQAKKQMDYLLGTVLKDDRLFAEWLGVDQNEL